MGIGSNVSCQCSPLSSAQTNHISKDLTICQAFGKMNEFQLSQYGHDFTKTSGLADYLYNRTTVEGSLEYLPGMSDKLWTPGEQHDRYMDMQIHAVKEDIIKACERHHSVRSIISKSNKGSVLNNFMKLEAKGGAVLALDCSYYKASGFRQLRNTIFYVQLPSNPTEKLSRETKGVLVHSAQGRQDHLCDTQNIDTEKVRHRPLQFTTTNCKNVISPPAYDSHSATVTMKIPTFSEILITNIASLFLSCSKDTIYSLREVSNLRVSAGS